MEQNHQRHRGGVEVCPQASSEDEFFFSSSDTTQLELSSVFRIAIPLFGWLLLLFISLFRSSSSYTCQSSRPILECTSPQPFFLASCKQLWPPSRCPRVTSTSTGLEYQLCVFNTEVMAPLGVVSPPSPYGQPIGISLAILRWTAWVTWHLPLLCLWPAEDTTAFSRTIWRLGLSPSVLDHFLLFGVGLGLDI